MVKEKRGGWVLEGLSIPVRSQWRLEAAGEGEGLVFGPRGRLGQSFWDGVGTGPRFSLPALAANLPTYMTCRRQPRDQTRAVPRRAWSVAHGRDDGTCCAPVLCPDFKVAGRPLLAAMEVGGCCSVHAPGRLPACCPAGPGGLRREKADSQAQGEAAGIMSPVRDTGRRRRGRRRQRSEPEREKTPPVGVPVAVAFWGLRLPGQGVGGGDWGGC